MKKISHIGNQISSLEELILQMLKYQQKQKYTYHDIQRIWTHLEKQFSKHWTKRNKNKQIFVYMEFPEKELKISCHICLMNGKRAKITNEN